MKNNDEKKFLIKFFNRINKFELKDISYKGIERFQSIVEYDFYVINLVGTTTLNEKKYIFIKIIKKGKIKESLFCICDLIYEKYFNNNTKEAIMNKPKRVTIIEKENSESMNKVFLKFLVDNLSQKEVNIEINFIEISKILEQTKNQNLLKKGWEKYIEINPKDIIIVGVKK